MKSCFLLQALLSVSFLFSEASFDHLEDVSKIMQAPKYRHGIWGIHLKDLESGKETFFMNEDKLFSPASTTKLFSTAAFFHAFGPDYRFKTPVYGTKPVENGRLQGDLVLVASGDLVFGGRKAPGDLVAFTALDHINANEVPGVSLTPQDPLGALVELAKQIYNKGVREIDGDVVIDDTLFETTVKRGMTLSPIAVNENLIDFSISSTSVGQGAQVEWRPKVPSYTVINNVKTTGLGQETKIEVTADATGKKMTVSGTVAVQEKPVIRTYPIKDPKSFAKEAFIECLKAQGIAFKQVPAGNLASFKPDPSFELASYTSPPLSEYVKLILKVSHNFGADLVPLLIASKNGKKTFDEGMELFGEFVLNEVKVPKEEFVFVDAAGGNENRLTPKAEVKLLEYVYKKTPEQFKSYFNALPILGVDGSLQDFAKQSKGAGKIRAKPGTGVAFNQATNEFFLITQALSGYIQGRNGHLFAYALIVNNASMPKIDDIFAIFEDEGQLSSLLYEKETN